MLSVAVVEGLPLVVLEGVLLLLGVAVPVEVPLTDAVPLPVCVCVAV